MQNPYATKDVSKDINFIVNTLHSNRTAQTPWSVLGFDLTPVNPDDFTDEDLKINLTFNKRKSVWDI